MTRFDPQENELIFWGGIGIIVLGSIALWMMNLLPGSAGSPATAVDTATVPINRTPVALSSPSATPSPLPTPSATVTPSSETRAAEPPRLPTVTPPPGGTAYEVTPAPDAVGWTRNNAEERNYFGDFNVYAGTFDGETYVGGLRFDLSDVPYGAEILYADLTLTGLSEEHLRADGRWSVELLEWWMEEGWSRISHFGLAREDGTALTLRPVLSREDIAVDRTNTLVLDSEALDLLEAHVYDGAVAFRITGPSEEETLFSWDAGSGSGSRGRAPLLRLVTGPAPATPPPAPTPAYHIITPVPKDLLAAAPLYATATAQATTTGTATPLPGNWVTPAIVQNTPTPANAATATYVAAVGTTQARLFGTPTPLPPNAWTVTPEPTPRYVVAENMLTALPLAASATARADTSSPVQIVTPIVVENTPRPGNAATATYVAAVATSQAALFGTPTPLPPYAWTATPERLVVPVEELEATPTPTPTPAALPAAVRGKIAFYSDRLGQPELFVMDPDGSNVAQLRDSWVYEFAKARDAVSPQSSEEVFVAQPADASEVPQLFIRAADDSVRQLTDVDGISYDPSWSPDGNRIAFVSQAPGNDEIFTISTGGSDLQRLTSNTWEWDKHPSWSPDGTRIVFMSNRGEAGRRQIWIMNADGSAPRNVSNNEFEEWDPVWIK